MRICFANFWPGAFTAANGAYFLPFVFTQAFDAVEFTEADIPARFFPPGGNSAEDWEFLFYSNLVTNFIDEITDPGVTSQGDFAQGALVQETINAFEESFRRRAWVDFPLEAPAIAAAS